MLLTVISLTAKHGPSFRSHSPCGVPSPEILMLQDVRGTMMANRKSQQVREKERARAIDRERERREGGRGEGREGESPYSHPR